MEDSPELEFLKEMYQWEDEQVAREKGNRRYREELEEEYRRLVEKERAVKESKGNIEKLIEKLNNFPEYHPDSLTKVYTHHPMKVFLLTNYYH